MAANDKDRLAPGFAKAIGDVLTDMKATGINRD